MARSAIYGAWKALAVAAGLVLVTTGAAGQTPIPNVVLAIEDDSIFWDDQFDKDDWAGSYFNDLDDAVDEAKSRDDDGVPQEVWVVKKQNVGEPVPRAWQASIVLDEDDNVSLLGFPFEEPYNVIIESHSTGLPVIELEGVPETVKIEGLTLTGGSDGALLTLDAAASIYRCYINYNTEHGIKIGDNAVPSIVNCSIFENGMDGINIDQDAVCSIVHTSIIYNTLRGVYMNLSASSAIYSADAIYAANGVYNSLVYSNGGGGIIWSPPPIAALDPILRANNVYWNPPITGLDQNYTDPSLAINSISENPELLSPADPDFLWLGQISIFSPMIDEAEEFAWSPRVDLGFEGRPIALFDIGADEFTEGGILAQSWYFCEVTPRSPVGKLEAGQLRVEIRTTGMSPESVFIVPQGGDASDLDDRIIIDPSFNVSGLFIGTNQQAIDTVLDPEGAETPSVGDLIADGHGAVYMRDSDLLFGDPILGNDFIPPFTDNDVIQGQARVGRHILIDTIPPQLRVGAGLSAWNLVEFDGTKPEALPTSFSAMTLAAEMPETYHPFPPPSGMRQVLDPWPYDDGLITETPHLGGKGAQIFFNTGSWSNIYESGGVDTGYFYDAARDLSIVIRATVEDLPVTDNNGVEVGGLDPFTGLNNRQVGGFEVFDGTPIELTLDDLLLDYMPIRWECATCRDNLSGHNVLVEATTLGSNAGFNYSVGSGIEDQNNREVSARWTFRHEFTWEPGIQYDLAESNAPYHLPIQFDAQDAAGNRIEADQLLLDPLHIWWLLTTSTVISPNREGETVQFPSFSWRLDRGFEPKTAGALKPQFTYRFWKSDSKAGPFEPITEIAALGDWAPWTTRTTLSFPDFQFWGLPDLLPAGQRWLLMVVLGMDEAGNIEPWPGGALTLQADDSVDVNGGATGGRNWQRFELSGTLAPETGVKPLFWHNRTDVPNWFLDPGEPSFGAATIVPLPTEGTPYRVEGQFLVSLIGDIDLMDVDDDGVSDAMVSWELLEDGAYVVGGPDLPAGVADPKGKDSVTVVLPWDGEEGGLLASAWRFGDHVYRRVPRTYIFRAAAFVDDPVTGVHIDPTPASVQFTVVPHSAEDFVSPKDSPDDQPIKIQEIR